MKPYQNRLQQLFQIDKHYTPIANQNKKNSKKFELLPKLVNSLHDDKIKCVFIIAENLSCAQHLVLMLKQKLSEIHSQSESAATAPTFYTDIDCDQIAEKAQGFRNILKQIKSQIANSLLQSQAVNSTRTSNSCVVILQNFSSLKNKDIQVAQYLQKKFLASKQSFKFIVTCSNHYMTEQEIDYCFYTQKLVAYLQPFNSSTQKLILRKMNKNIEQLKIQKYNIQICEASKIDQIQNNQVLSKLGEDINNFPILIFTLPHIDETIASQAHRSNLSSRYKILNLFVQECMKCQFEFFSSTDADVKNKLLQYYKQENQATLSSIQDYAFKDAKTLFEMLSWKTLQLNRDQTITLTEYEQIIAQFDQFHQSNIIDIADILLVLVPILNERKTNLQFINKSICQFFVSHSIIHETLKVGGDVLDYKISLLNSCFLSNDIEILQIVGEYVMHLPLENEQYPHFYLSWQKSALISKKIRSKEVSEANEILQIKHLASNCLSLLASTPHCDLTNRDFSECTFVNAYLFGRDLSSCNFSNADLQKCDFRASTIDKCLFYKSNLSENKFGIPQSILRAPIKNLAFPVFSPDGKILASVNEYGVINLRWLWYNRESINLRTNCHGVNYLAFSPDGKLLASGCNDSKVRLWNIKTRRIIFTLGYQQTFITNISLVFSPDSKTLLSMNQNTIIEIWDLYSMRKIANKQMGINSFQYLWDLAAISPDSKLLAKCFGRKNLQIWEIKSTKQLATFTGNSGEVWQMVFSPNSKMLASASFDNTVILLDLQKMKLIMTFKGHYSRVSMLAFSSDSKILASCGSDNSIKVWSTQSYTEIAALKNNSTIPTSMIFSPDSKILVIGSNDIGLQLLEVYIQTKINTIRGHQGQVLSVAFSPDNKILASGSADCTIKIWDMESKIEIAVLEGHLSQVYSVAFSPDSQTLASGSLDDTIKLWSTQKNKEICTLKEHSGLVYSVAFSPDSKLLASGSWDQSIILWDLDKKVKIVSLLGHSSRVYQVAFSPDSKILASGSFDQTVKLWNLNTKQEISTLKGHQKDVTSLAFSPHFQIIASGSDDQSIKLWNMQSKLEITTLLGHSNLVLSVQFSPDGKILASGSADNTIKIWGLQTMKEIITIKEYQSWVQSVAFSPDSKIMASGNSDSSIKLYKISNDKTLPATQKSILNNQENIEFSCTRDLTISSTVPIFSCQGIQFEQCSYSNNEEQQYLSKLFKDN